jgi:hypothetical protein
MWELHGDPFLKVFDWSPVPLTPDFDGDSDVDLVDYAAFQMCFNGPNQLPAQANCQQTDFDLDCDVDLADFSVFQSCFNGPNRPLRCQPP